MGSVGKELNGEPVETELKLTGIQPVPSVFWRLAWVTQA